ncbi:MAG: Smg protein [Pseudomonadota bacterium]|jgi:Smg protein|nr:Smg protein [Pseudomonadota bacterium]MDQ5880204.1 Smg protein [Pseudomonadota bacterium]MDQ5905728.1 Smg protein [Pseudomonadota bacterium]MDQ5917027.1 Smg protein [Pseudomonadota bacterium]MDQ5946876.1 Smg protein [Pseudomonadota bacterium]
MIDVLVFLFENYFDISTHPAPDTLVRKLSAAGFDPDEISLALDWLHELKTARPSEFVADSRAIRVYTDDEQTKLADGCLDFIVFLETAGVVKAPLRELILDRAMGLEDDRVSLEKLKIIVLMVLWSQDQDLEPLIIEELLNPPEDVLAH